MTPATLKNLDIFEGRQGNIEERQYSSKYAIMESAAAFVADFVPAMPRGGNLTPDTA
jgi:hypothetical protein